MGQVFTDLTVVCRAKNGKWLCRCVCGNECLASAGALRAGDNKSCGCLSARKADLTGKTFGRLTVISEDGRQGGDRVWLCRCECGGKTRTAGADLKKKSTVSCGCWRKERMRITAVAAGNPDVKDALVNYLHARCRRTAKARGLEFSLSVEDVRRITFANCHYCGGPPLNLSKPIMRQGQAIEIPHNGIDRVDNDNGYVPHNVVACCKLCNIGKKDYSVDEFLEWVTRVYKFSVEKKSVSENDGGNPRVDIAV